MQVTLIDPEKNPGGVCLYAGCIPSKALLHVAKVIDEAQHATEWGVDLRRAEDRRRPLRAYKDRVVEKLTGGTGQVAKLRKVNYIQGRASIVDPTTPAGAKARMATRRRRRLPDPRDRLAPDEAFPRCRSTARACSTRPARSTCRRSRRRCSSSAAATSASSSGRCTRRSAPRSRSSR
jgi:hypothetical protein